jgi:hypothetical protein
MHSAKENENGLTGKKKFARVHLKKNSMEIIAGHAEAQLTLSRCRSSRKAFVIKSPKM